MQPETLPHNDNRVDLDPRRRDRWGLPLPRVTFEFHQNERRLQKFMASVGDKIMRATGASKVWTEEKGRPNRWAGGTSMGADPQNSVVNEYCQSHDVANLFILGSSVFPDHGRLSADGDGGGVELSRGGIYSPAKALV